MDKINSDERTLVAMEFFVGPPVGAREFEGEATDEGRTYHDRGRLRNTTFFLSSRDVSIEDCLR